MRTRQVGTNQCILTATAPLSKLQPNVRAIFLGTKEVITKRSLCTALFLKMFGPSYLVLLLLAVSSLRTAELSSARRQALACDRGSFSTRNGQSFVAAERNLVCDCTPASLQKTGSQNTSLKLGHLLFHCVPCILAKGSLSWACQTTFGAQSKFEL